MNENASRFRQARLRMVDEQLAPRGISDPRVLAAMRTVPREEFVPESLRHAAYTDKALALRLGQTISQPFTVAIMCQALQLRGDEKILDIGTGSGYAAAVLSLLAREVVSIERLPELADAARATLAQLGYLNVAVIVGDGSLGFAAEAPFDAIVAAAAAKQLPQTLPSQLADGGRIVLPIGDPNKTQTMRRYLRRGDAWIEDDLGQFSFVPLICD